MLDFDAMAGVEPAFHPAHFTIDPHNLPASAHALAEGVADGYGAGAAVTLLQHNSAKAHVSFDRMLFLTDHDLGALTSASAMAGKTHFDATIELRLGNGVAESALALAAHHAELTAPLAASTLVGLAKAVTPGPHEISHDLALLIHDLQVDKVAAKSIDAVAVAHAKALLSGVAEQVLLGGSHAPAAVDVAAAAKVVEQHLPHFTKAALTKLDAVVRALEGTHAERAVLHQVETQALKDAFVDHLLTRPLEKPWTAAFALPNEHLDAVDKQVLTIAAQLAAARSPPTTPSTIWARCPVPSPCTAICPRATTSSTPSSPS
jgi:hypothetical protein